MISCKNIIIILTMNLENKKDLQKILIDVYENIEISETQLELFQNIIKDTTLESIDENNNSIITIESPFYKTILENNFKNHITKSLNHTLNGTFKIIFMLKNDYKKTLRNDDEILNLTPKEDQMFPDEQESSIKEKLNFENYVVTNSNKMIYSAALAVSDNPGGPWNPLFIYGGSGLGKTHLLHAIGNAALQKFSNFKVKYIPAKDFGELIHQAIKSGKNTINNIETIKSKYIDYNMLLIDDIQFIQNQNKAKEIFFHIFNDFIEKDKQVVITSDKYPQELGNFEQRLVTRFEKGLTIGVLPPDFEGAKEIIKVKLKTIHDFDQNLIEEEGIEYIAQHFSNNVRELEGAINRIIFWTINTDQHKITLQNIEEIFKSLKKKKKTATFDEIIQIVSDYYNISKSEIFGIGRKKNILLSRQICIYLSRNLLNMSLMDIGKKFNKNHSTVINSINKIEKGKELDQNLNIALSKIHAQILK